jgi:hypothetical protein
MKKIQISILALTVFLSGCSSLGKTYSQINPEGAAEEVRKHNGYYELKKIPEGNSKIVLRGLNGQGISTVFSISKSKNDCAVLEKIGTTTDNLRDILLPQVVKMTASLSAIKNLEYLKIDVNSNEPITIHGNGRLYVGHTSGSCGPLAVEFIPKSKRSYLIEFNWRGNQCKLDIFDATDPDKPMDVEVTSRKILPLCKN